MNDRAPIRDRTLVLRILVPGLDARLREKMKEVENTATAIKNDNKNLYLGLKGVFCVPTAQQDNTLWDFHCDGVKYPAKLVNLPCPVEVHKTHDHAVYYKCADIAQMLLVYEDDKALKHAAEEKPVKEFPSYYHSGLTPPTKRIVERRFAAREHKTVAPGSKATVAKVEKDLIELLEKIAKDDKAKKNKIPTLISANKVLEEVVEEVVDYEPWMSDYGQQPDGVELKSDEELCYLHPEVWLDPSVIREAKESHQESSAKQKEAAPKKGTEKNLGSKTHSSKKCVASKMETEVETAAAWIHRSNGNIEDDDFSLDLSLNEATLDSL